MQEPDIDSSIKQWRANLGLSEGISMDAIDELEAHLRESIDELKSKGLTGEEAFIIAARRLGKLDSLDQEFSAISTPVVWNRRAFWMLLGFIDISALILLVNLIGGLGISTAVAFAPYNMLPIWSAMAYITPVLILVATGIFTWKQLLHRSPSTVARLIGRHSLFLSVAALALILVLKAGGSGLMMLNLKTLSMEAIGTIALHAKIASFMSYALVLIAVCTGLAILGKSLLPPKTS